MRDKMAQDTDEWKTIADKPQFLSAKGYAVGEKIVAKILSYEGMSDNKFLNRRATFTCDVKGQKWILAFGAKNIRTCANVYGVKNPKELEGKSVTMLVQTTNTGNSFELIALAK